jgi:acyl-CoA thioesterase FadM
VTEQPQVRLTISTRLGETVILEAETTSGHFPVVTFPLRLTRGGVRMFALLSEPARNAPLTRPETLSEPLTRDVDPDCSEYPLPPLPNRLSLRQATESSPRPTGMPDGGIDSFCHSVNVADDGPDGQPVQELRFVVSFQEASTISRHVPAAQFMKWMGRMRELVTSFNVPSLVEQIATGEWGLVTNYGDVHVHGELTANDVVLMRFWTHLPRGSEVEYCCDFWKLHGDGTREHVAFAEQKATWVRLIGHGQVVPAPLPEALAAFIGRMAPKPQPARSARSEPMLAPSDHDYRSHTLQPDPVRSHVARLCWEPSRAGDSQAGHPHEGSPIPQLHSLAHCHGGKVEFAVPPGPSPMPPVWRSVFETTLEESNLVGNIYYANYFSWQRRLLDQFLYTIDRNYLRGIGAAGEMICLRSRMDFLREAMPFDPVRVAMCLRTLSECGAEFQFEFHRVLDDGVLQKLSIGKQLIVWAQRDARSRPTPTPWPAKLYDALRNPSDLAHPHRSTGPTAGQCRPAPSTTSACSVDVPNS